MPTAAFSDELLRILACPRCHQTVEPGPDAQDVQWLRCTGCSRYYPVENGILVMLEARATTAPPALSPAD